MRKAISFVRNVVSPDRNRRFYAAKLFGEFLVGDFRITWPQMDWWQDASFNEYLRRFGEIDGFNTHRKWTLSQLLRLVDRVEGDTAECGVFEGGSSWLICAARRNHKGVHHLFDSFEGLSAPDSTEDGEHWHKGALSASEALVLENLREFANGIESHKGWIPRRFGDVSDRRFSFVHVDVDLYSPTKDSIEFFYDRINPGGIFLCDDYACRTCPGATKSVDQYLQDKPEKMISLDAGGGFFIKGVTVGPNAVTAFEGAS